MAKFKDLGGLKKNISQKHNISENMLNKIVLWLNNHLPRFHVDIHQWRFYTLFT